MVIINDLIDVCALFIGFRIIERIKIIAISGVTRSVDLNLLLNGLLLL